MDVRVVDGTSNNHIWEKESLAQETKAAGTDEDTVHLVKQPTVSDPKSQGPSTTDQPLGS